MPEQLGEVINTILANQTIDVPTQWAETERYNSSLGFTYGTATTNNGNVTAATIMDRPGTTYNFSQSFGYL